MKEHDVLHEIMRDAKIGWWVADRKRCVFRMSEELQELLGLSTDEISYADFRDMIDPPYREYVFVSSGLGDGRVDNERVYPLNTSKGKIWCRGKYLHREIADDGTESLIGYFQITSAPQSAAQTPEARRIDDLSFRLNSISRTLLSLLQTDKVDFVINKILADVLTMFGGGRVYIIESDMERRVYDCTYEVTADHVTEERDLVSGISMEEVPWWTERILHGRPIVISDLAELPEEAFREREVLAAQDIKSLIAVPLVSRDKVWGYAGIDIVEQPRIWSEEDYQWFSSLINIVSICVELQRSEQAEQSERAYLESLYRHMPLGYSRMQIIKDQNGNPVDYIVCDANFAADKITGIPRDLYLNKRASSFGVDTLQYLPLFAQVFDSGEYLERDTYETVSDRWIHTILYTTCKDEIVSLFSDTTDVHNAHEALFASEKMLRNIFDNAQVGIELYDKEGYLVDLNNKDLEIFGVRNKEDALGVNFFENPIVPEEIRANVRAGQEKAFKLDYSFENLNGYYASGKTQKIQIYSKVTMLYNMHGELVNYLAINIDNTEINEAYSRLAEFESSFSLVSCYGKVGYARFDLMTRDGYAVQQWLHNLGEASDTPVSQVIGIYNHVDPEDRESIFREIRRVKAGESDGFNLDLRIQNEDGTMRWTRVNVIRNPLNTDPSKIEMVCVNFDVTELKETEKNLIEAKNKAEVSDRLKSAFLANMSHEIRTPLNAIVGFSGLLAEEEELEVRQEYMRIVKDNNDLLLKLISDILDLSKIEAGTFEFVYAPVDVNRMCEETVRALGLKVTDKPVELLFGEHESVCEIVSDKNRLVQVITNFINNAVKFTTEGSITLGYRREKENLLFYVRDTGTGISAAQLPTVFERFVKLNSFVQGTGLGLSISKSIIEQMGGRIGVESEEGQGSCFWFTVPVSAYDKAEPKSTTTLSPNGELPQLLVVEDTDSNYLLVSLTMCKEFEVIRARNGADAVRMCGELHPAAVLMDIKLPGMDGLEATRRIRDFDTSVPIIVVTAFAHDHDRERALEAGANDYMAKPLNGTQLRRMLHTMITEK